MTKADTASEAELLAARYAEAGQIEALLRESAQTIAADLVASRLGGMRDALAVLGVDIEAGYAPPPANDTGPETKPAKDEGQTMPPLHGPEDIKVQRGKRIFSAAALERLRAGARKQHAQRAAKKAQA